MEKGLVGQNWQKTVIIKFWHSERERVTIRLYCHAIYCKRKQTGKIFKILFKMGK